MEVDALAGTSQIHTFETYLLRYHPNSAYTAQLQRVTLKSRQAETRDREPTAGSRPSADAIGRTPLPVRVGLLAWRSADLG